MTHPAPTANRAPTWTAPSWLALSAVVLGGACAAAQAAVNGELASRLDSALWAAAVSNTLGGAVFVVALLASRRVRAGLRAVWRHRLPWWMYTGGVFGAVFVFAGATAVPLVGVALFTVAQVSGNTVGALGTDALGLGPAGRLRVTWRRLVGAALAIGAVALAQTGRHADGDHWWLLPLIVLVGTGIALQGAFNGQINETSRNPLSTGLVNFLVGTSVLYVVVGAIATLGALPTPRLPDESWLYLGGPCGAALVVATMIAIRAIGVLRMALGVLAGQLAGAVLLDVARTGTLASPWVLVSVLVTAAAVVLAGTGRAPALVTAPDEAVGSHDGDDAGTRLDR